MKYLETMVTFSEVPDEISLCISISNCPGKCKGCHSPELRENIGYILDCTILEKLIEDNKGITCVCFLGGDNEVKEINNLAKFVHTKKLKSAWYSGKDDICLDIDIVNFDFIKIGRYIEELGPLTSKDTNQVMYEVIHLFGDFGEEFELEDITFKFWKNNKI